MRHFPTALLLLAAASVASAQTYDETRRAELQFKVYRSASDLVPWCRMEAERHAVGKGRTVYQWTSSYSDRDATLEVEGRLHVNDADLMATCRVARGATGDYATIEVVEVPR
jgi:hypothetical protein